MALIHSMESSGNFLFRYRGQIPVVLFLLAIPVIYFTNFGAFGSTDKIVITALSIAVSFAGLVVRAITIGTSAKNTSGRNTQKQVADVLNTTGIYSTLRHPLYLGNYLMWIGIVMFTFNFYFIVIVTLAYWLYYERIMFAEERFLERKFGDMYLNWSKQIPAFIPSMKNFKKNEVPFSMKVVLRREYSGFFATVLGFVFIDVWRELFINEMEFELNMNHIYVLGGAGAITLVLRTLKKTTKVLHEEDRS